MQEVTVIEVAVMVDGKKLGDYISEKETKIVDLKVLLQKWKDTVTEDKYYDLFMETKKVLEEKRWYSTKISPNAA